jgi:hypothetical protein
MPFPTAILFLAGIGFVGFGLAYAIAPVRMAALTQVAVPTGTARADFTATYGGLQLGIGVFLLLCTRTPAWTIPGLWAALTTMGGFAALRILGILRAHGRLGAAIWIALAIEILGVALTLIALQLAA